MKVQELLANITNENFNLSEALEVKTYLPMELKKTIAQGIIFDCTDDSEGAIKVDSVERYMSYVRHMIIHHTNLEYTDNDYDALCSTEYEEVTLLNAIMDCFGADAKECSKILDLMTNDYIQENSIEFSVVKLLNRFSNSIDKVLGVVGDKINDFDFQSALPDDIDFQQIKEFLSTYGE